MKKLTNILLTLVIIGSVLLGNTQAYAWAYPSRFEVEVGEGVCYLLYDQERIAKVLLGGEPDDSLHSGASSVEYTENGGIVLTVPDGSVLLWEDEPNEMVKVFTSSGEDISSMKALTSRGNIYYIEKNQLWVRSNPEWEEDEYYKAPTLLAEGALELRTGEDPMSIDIYLGKDAVLYEEANDFSTLNFIKDASTEFDLMSRYSVKWKSSFLLDSTTNEKVAWFATTQGTPIWGIVDDYVYVVVDEGTEWYDFVPVGCRWLRVIDTQGRSVEPSENEELELPVELF